MPRLIIMRGLPASGKSTRANQLLTESRALGGNTVRVNRDLLRTMLHNDIWSNENERITRDVRDVIIRKTLGQGIDVIVDDTNLRPQDVPYFRDMVKRHGLGNGIEVEVVDFLHVPLDECLRRDRLREKPVGEAVIMGMWEKWIKSEESICTR